LSGCPGSDTVAASEVKEEMSYVQKAMDKLLIEVNKAQKYL